MKNKKSMFDIRKLILVIGILMFLSLILTSISNEESVLDSIKNIDQTILNAISEYAEYSQENLIGAMHVTNDILSDVDTKDGTYYLADMKDASKRVYLNFSEDLTNGTILKIFARQDRGNAVGIYAQSDTTGSNPFGTFIVTSGTGDWYNITLDIVSSTNAIWLGEGTLGTDPKDEIDYVFAEIPIENLDFNIVKVSPSQIMQGNVVQIISTVNSNSLISSMDLELENINYSMNQTSINTNENYILRPNREGFIEPNEKGNYASAYDELDQTWVDIKAELVNVKASGLPVINADINKVTLNIRERLKKGSGEVGIHWAISDVVQGTDHSFVPDVNLTTRTYDVTAERNWTADDFNNIEIHTQQSSGDVDTEVYEVWFEVNYTEIINDVWIYEINTTNLADGNYSIKLHATDVNGSIISYNENFIITPELIFVDGTIKDANDQPVNISIEIYDEDDNLEYNETGDSSHATSVKKGKKKIKIKPKKHKIKKIEFGEVNIDSNLNGIIEIDNLTNKKYNNLINTFAINPLITNFSNATVLVDASGKTLFKCKDWNFTTQKCEGRWKKLAKLTPGQEYNITLTPDDPGFGENNESVIVLDTGDYLINSTQTLLANNSGILDLEIVPLEEINDTIENITILGYDESEVSDELIIDDNVTVSDSRFADDSLLIMDAENLSFTNISFKSKQAKGNKLLRCENWNESNISCIDNNWKKVKDITKNQDFNHITNRTKTTYAETKDVVVVFDKEFNLLQYNQNITNDNTTIADIEYEFIGLKIKKLKVHKFNRNSQRDELMLEESIANLISPSGKKAAEFSIDPENISFTYAELNVTATGKHLFKCVEWNASDQTCYGSWKKIRSLIPGQDYTLNITAQDPGFLETNNSIIVIDDNDTLLTYNETQIADYGNNISDYLLNISNSDIHNITIYNHNESAVKNELIVNEDILNDTRFIDTLEVDAQNLSFENISLKKKAKGNKLLKCEDWNETSESCNDNWKKVKDITKNQNFNHITNRTKTTYAETKDVVVVFDKEFNLLQYNQNITNDNTTIADVEYEFIGLKIKKLKVHKFNRNSQRDELMLESTIANLISPSGKKAAEFSIDPENISFTYAELNVTATGKHLFKCVEWNASDQTCYGSWKKIRSLIPGQEYTLNITAQDPGYLETNNSIVIIDDNESLLSYNETILNNDSGILDIALDIDNSPSIQEVIVYDFNESANNQLKIKVNSFVTGYAKSYSIDPTILSFDNATVTVIATGNELYKCPSWNFTTQICTENDWTLFKTGLNPGQTYTFTLTPGDPGFGEILITDARHLDENRTFISNIYNEVKAQDDIWSENISNNEYVRVDFNIPLDSHKDITIVPRTISGIPRIEVYEENGSEVIAEFTSIINNQINKVFLSALSGTQDTFDLKILDGIVQFDYITDPPATGSPNAPLAFFIDSQNYLSSDKAIAASEFTESPIVLNDYGKTTEKCSNWDCSAWSVSDYQKDNYRCSGGWNCTTWNGVTCAQYNCTQWYSETGGDRFIDYCDGGWNLSSNGFWNCTAWSETFADTDRDPYCNGIWNCTAWDGDNCNYWDCTSWADDPIDRTDFYCSGAWDCIDYNDGICGAWNCTAWSDTDTVFGDKYDHYCSNGWNCSAWNGDVCDNWECLGDNVGAASSDVYCDVWNCTTWDEERQVCQYWNCSSGWSATNQRSSYCSGTYDCQAWETASYESVTWNQSTLNLGYTEQDSGDLSGTANITSSGNNTDVVVTCVSGNCSLITDDWVDDTNMVDNENQTITFTCNDSTLGELSADFFVNSSNDTVGNTITVTCSILADANFTYLSDRSTGITTPFGYIDGSLIDLTYSSNSIHLQSGELNGTYTSQIIDTGDLYTIWNNISWQSNLISLSGGINLSNNILFVEFNETAVNQGPGGSDAEDHSIYDSHGNETGGVNFSVEGRFGTAAGFDGVNDYIFFGNDSSLVMAGDLAISLWVNLRATPTANTVFYTYTESGEAENTNTLYELFVNTGRTIQYKHEYAAGSDQAYSFNHDPFNIGEWYHVVLLRDTDANLVSLYVNGIQVDNYTYANDPTGGEIANLYLGADGAGLAEYINASIDQLAMWDRELSEEEISELYELGVSSLNISIRSCNDSNCDTENWIDIADDSPQDLSISDNRYFQYKFDFDRNDEDLNLELYNVTAVMTTIPPNITIHSPTPIVYGSLTVALNVNANEAIDTWTYNVNGTNYSFTPNITIAGVEGNNTLYVWATDLSNNIVMKQTWFVVDTIIDMALIDYYGLDSVNARINDFNTTYLEEIEYLVLNFTINSSGLGNITDWYLNFTANGTNSCSLGNKQSSICYNYTNGNPNYQWIQFKDNVNTVSYDGIQGNQGDRIIETVAGNVINRNLVFKLDEHYNPNVMKWYGAGYNFSDVKWQDGADQKITKNNYLKISIGGGFVPTTADQYKLDFRINTSASPPSKPLEAWRCNTTYTTGDPAISNNCQLIATKTKTELQDNGNKFRAILTQHLIETIPNGKYIVLKTSEPNPNKYYALKTYNATTPGWTTHWQYSTDKGSTWINNTDGYETELNVNWFYGGIGPTELIYSLWVNTTEGTENYLEGNITWEIDPSQNYMPLVSLTYPDNGENIVLPYNVTFTVIDPNEDNTNVSIYLYNLGGTLNSTLITDMNQSNNSYLWVGPQEDGNYSLVLEACELGTSELYCVNDTRSIRIDNTRPIITIHSPTQITYDTATVSLDVNADEAIDTWTYNVNGTNYSFTPNITIDGVEGNNTLYVWANDSLGNMKMKQTWFVVDTTDPTITIHSPTQITYDTATVSLDVNADEAIDTWTYNVNGTNYSFTPNITIDGVEGNNTLYIWANDSLGNMKMKQTWFVVDTTDPVITNLTETPILPIYNNGDEENISVDFNSSEYPINITFNLYNSTGSIVDTVGPTQVNNVGELPLIYTIPDTLDDGTYILNMTVNDSYGNDAKYNLGSFTVDAVAPTITIHSPINDTYNVSTIDLKVTVDETISVWYRNLNDGGNFTFTPNTTIIGSDGLNILYIYANDSANNWGVVTVVFTIDILPEINLTENDNQTVLNYTLNVTEDYGDGTYDLELNVTSEDATLITVNGFNESGCTELIFVSHTNETWGEADYSITADCMIFDNITLEVVAANATYLYKCTNWNAANQTCISDNDWELIQYLTPGQTYVVTINETDPGFVELNVTNNDILYDGAAFENDAGDERGAWDRLRVRNDTGANQYGLFMMNLSSVPNNVIIDSANFQLTCQGDNMEATEEIGTGVSHVYTNFTWTEGTGTQAAQNACTGNEFCWNNLPATGQFNNSIETELSMPDGCAGTAYNFSVIQMVTRNYNEGKNNVSIYLRPTGNNIGVTNDNVRFWTKEAATAANAPKLYLSYHTVPRVADVQPAAGTNYNQTDIVTISANVTEIYPAIANVSSVRANITYPNTTVITITLTDGDSDNIYDLNFTNTNLVGRYNITIIANNTDGYVNSSETTYFIVNDVTIPIITIHSPLQQTYDTATVSLDVNADEAIDTWTYNVNGTNYSFTPNITIDGVEGNNTLYIWANDSLGNMKMKQTWFVVDTTDPVITIHSPTQITYDTATVSLDVNADEAIDTWTYNVNGTNYSFTPNITIDGVEGNNTLYIWANDSLGNMKMKQTWFVVDTTAPTITIHSPTQITYDTATVSLDVNADTAVDTWTYNVNGTNYSFTPNITIDGVEGNNTLYVWANDSLGNIKMKQTWFVVDTTDPTITIHSPQNGSIYGSTTVSLNVNADEAIDTWIYSLDGGVTNVTFSPNTTFTGVEGGNTITIWINDSANNVGVQTSIFIVNTGNPVVTIISPSNINYTGAAILLNITATNGAALIDKIWYNWNGSNYTFTTVVNITFAEGINTLDAWANDTVSNEGHDVVTFTVDTIAPTFDNLANQTIAIGQSLSYDIDATDVTSAIDTWTVNDTINFAIDSNGVLTNISALSLGIYWLNVTVNDTVGNQVSGIIFVNVTNLAVITDTQIYPEIVINGTDVELYIRAINAEAVWANITLPNTTVITIQLTNNANTTFSNTNLTGNYTVEFFANNSAGDITSLDSWFFVTEALEFLLDIVDENITGVDSSLIIYYQNGTIAQNSSATGNYSVKFIPDYVYDLEFRAYTSRLRVYLDNVNVSLDNNKTFGMDRLDIAVDDYLVTYGVEDIDSMTFTNARVTIYYDDLSFDTESRLELFVCNDWNFTDQSCDGGWTDITSSAVQDNINDYFEYETTSFSGFSIREEEADSTPSGGSTGGTSCVTEWKCEEWSECKYGRQTRSCEKEDEDCRTHEDKPNEIKKCVVEEELVGEENITEEPVVVFAEERPAETRDCCLFKICWFRFIICWYWWILIIIVLIIAILILARRVAEERIRQGFAVRKYRAHPMRKMFRKIGLAIKDGIKSGARRRKRDIGKIGVTTGSMIYSAQKSLRKGEGQEALMKTRRLADDADKGIFAGIKSGRNLAREEKSLVKRRVNRFGKEFEEGAEQRGKEIKEFGESIGHGIISGERFLKRKTNRFGKRMEEGFDQRKRDIQEVGAAISGGIISGERLAKRRVNRFGKEFEENAEEKGKKLGFLGLGLVRKIRTGIRSADKSLKEGEMGLNGRMKFKKKTLKELGQAGEETGKEGNVIWKKTNKGWVEIKNGIEREMTILKGDLKKVEDKEKKVFGKAPEMIRSSLSALSGGLFSVQREIQEKNINRGRNEIEKEVESIKDKGEQIVGNLRYDMSDSVENLSKDISKSIDRIQIQEEVIERNISRAVLGKHPIAFGAKAFSEFRDRTKKEMRSIARKIEDSMKERELQKEQKEMVKDALEGKERRDAVYNMLSGSGVYVGKEYEDKKKQERLEELQKDPFRKYKKEVVEVHPEVQPNVIREIKQDPIDEARVIAAEIKVKQPVVLKQRQELMKEVKHLYDTEGDEIIINQPKLLKKQKPIIKKKEIVKKLSFNAKKYKTPEDTSSMINKLKGAYE